MSRADKLRAEILALSVEQHDFAKATAEWAFMGREVAAEKSECICGQTITIEFIIMNELNGNIATVGSTCIEKYMNCNRALVEDVVRAVLDARRHPCHRCAEVTSHREHCGKCARDLELLGQGWNRCQRCPLGVALNLYCGKCECQVRGEQLEQRRVMRKAGEDKWNRIQEIIRGKQLTAAESDFINKSVCWRIRNNHKLTDKQRTWLGTILRRCARA